MVELARASLSDYLELTPAMAEAQWRVLGLRAEHVPGVRQTTFLPIETLLCYAASRVVAHRRFGSSTAHAAPSPVPELASLFKRPNSSILAKMANLDGSRPNGGRHDSGVREALDEDDLLFRRIYNVILVAARSNGVDELSLPDFLGLLKKTPRPDSPIPTAPPTEESTSVVEESFRRSIFGPDARVMSSVRARQGQAAFRQQLLAAYDGACTATGTRVLPLLEAAHIVPHAHGGSYATQNGLLLRADVHTLFDIGYLAVDPRSWTTVVHESLNGTEYATRLNGSRITLPDDGDLWPDRAMLLERGRAAGLVS